MEKWARARSVRYAPGGVGKIELRGIEPKRNNEVGWNTKTERVVMETPRNESLCNGSRDQSSSVVVQTNRRAS